MKPLIELIIKDDSAWPLVNEWVAAATNAVEILPVNEAQRGDALYATQVTTRSPMGAIIYESGGLLIDDGWIRILGSGHPRLQRSLPHWNQVCGVKPAEYVLFADDVLGGFFALNGGALGESHGKVYYHAPDTLAWENLNKSYSEFLRFCCNGDLNKFYEGFRWAGWQAEVIPLAGDRAFFIYPPLWAEGPDVTKRHRGDVLLIELYQIAVSTYQAEERTIHLAS